MRSEISRPARLLARNPRAAMPVLVAVAVAAAAAAVPAVAVAVADAQRAAVAVVAAAQVAVADEVAVAAAGGPTSLSNTISFFLAIFRTVSASIASAIMAATKPMSA